MALGSTAAAPIDAQGIVQCFNACFATDGVVLRGGAQEPLYVPAFEGAPAVIHFRDDYVRSALHEVAHWCHAGRQRRRLPDYGYWYSPDDRSAFEQAAFFAVEVRPQALESLFCEALFLPFAPSVDNLSLDIPGATISLFNARIDQAVASYRDAGLPDRAQRFVDALMGLMRLTPASNEVSRHELVRS